MKKIRNFSYKDWQHFFFKRKISSISHLTQGKRKTYVANDLLALSLVNIIVYIYFLGKKFYCTYLKPKEHETITRTICKNIGKEKNHVSDFSALLKKKKQRKNTNLFCLYKNTQQ